ncbi:MAG: flavin reductase family protein [Clostridiales bacterium]|jgi:flavin reductase (DIM6/NTAB) family NADH-FMN oxidoreductase RutF|nr:flavin reductase family protein [Clostridiales bacterium]
MAFYDNLDTVMKHFIKKGGFLTAKAGEQVNTMTISWGFVGFVWGRPHFICFVRPQRHTYGIIERADSFTVSVPLGDMENELEICGTKSGRDTDKSQVVRFIPAKSVESPVVEGCGRYFECRINYKDVFDGEALPDFIKTANYKDDFHHMYFGEIVEAY